MKLSPEERIERNREYQKIYRQNRTEEQKKKLKEYFLKNKIQKVMNE